ncbi:unnamed protein product, partial [Prorocentrum cordatum]
MSARFCSVLSRQYDIHELLGSGSSSLVYRCTRLDDGRALALKVMRWKDPDRVDYFRQEHEMLRSLQHPHILRALEFILFEECGSAHSAMVLDYFPSTSLRRLVHRQCPLREEALRPLAAQLLSAVDYLHRLRIVHRDIKPENLLVADGCRSICLIDFNTAHRLREGAALTPTGTYLGWSLPPPRGAEGGPALRGERRLVLRRVRVLCPVRQAAPPGGTRRGAGAEELRAAEGAVLEGGPGRVPERLAALPAAPRQRAACAPCAAFPPLARRALPRGRRGRRGGGGGAPLPARAVPVRGRPGRPGRAPRRGAAA